ncbi:MAG TPA: ATP-binding protein [Acidobacteriaceae bacterium]|jgi:two-component system sensor histidine kinase KdpD|nr:ATP-binding protein [Acidobacteriaceae bacterium]
MLCEFVEKTTKLDPHRKPGPQIVSLVRATFDVEAAAILDVDLHEVYREGEWFDDLEDVLQSICLFETASDDRETGLIRRVLRIGKLPIGAVLLRGERSVQTANAIASIIAVSFDRYHAFASESRVESARRTEQMRTTVLDSLAHAYKTPLTAIEAASSGLIAMGGLTTAQSELVILIEEQADQLNQLTNRLLTTARLEASDLVLRVERVTLAPLIDDVLASLQEQLAGFQVTATLSRDDLSVRGDRSLLIALLTQYVDNASKYAEAGTNVTIQCVERSNAVVISVRSMGTVIPAADCERIFDRYYRSSVAGSRAPGTGIGLSIAKRAVQAHDGHVWVTSDASGLTTFYASLPHLPEGGAIP